MNYLAEDLYQAGKLIFPPNPEIFGTVVRSFLISGTATFIAAVIGLMLALLISFNEFKLKKLAIAIINTWIALPAVTIGLLVYIFLSRRGPLGSFGFLFSPYAIIIAQTILATPLITALFVAALNAVGPEIRETARTLGADKLQVAAAVMREAKFSLLIAVIVGFSRVIGETGMTMMVGGNIKGYTRVMTTAIALETMKGNFEVGIALGVMLLGCALIINIFIQFLRERTAPKNGNNGPRHQ
jgi:tungstate transport system permease protein